MKAAVTDMNIIVCMKQVPAAATASIDPLTKTIVRTGRNAVTNPFDLHALQTALNIRRTVGGKVTAVTMGIPAAEKVIKDAIGRGADGGALLSDRAFAGSDTLATSYTLSLGIEQLGGADLIVCGKMAVDGDTAQIGPELAEKLAIPHASDVCEITEAAADHLIVKRIWEETEQVLYLPLPALITVVKGTDIPNMPTITGMLKAKDASVVTMTAESLSADTTKCGLKGSPTQVVKTFTPPARGNAVEICGSADKQAAELAKICFGAVESISSLEN